MTDAALLDHITRLPHAKANFKQLVRELGAQGATRADLEIGLARLLARGNIVEPRPGHYVATAHSREYAVGRINMHRDGYGFLIAERPVEGIQGDVYIPADSARQAMHGDRVLVRIARIEQGGRADGEIVKVLKRAHPTVVGEFRVGRKGNYVVPQDGRIQQWI
ncbi:MAG: ribonuclease R, partial [Bryobacteraceae bacterium]